MTGTPCPKCGQPHPRCSAHAKTTGLPCMRWPEPGGRACSKHGGNGAGARQKAAERRAEQQAATELARGLKAAYGADVPDVDPTTAMLDAIRWKHAEVVWLRSKVAELDEDELTWGITKVKEGGDDRGTTQEAKPNIYLALLHTAEDQLVRFAKAARDAKIDERRIELAEGQAQLIAGAIGQLLAALLGGLIAALAGLDDARERIETEWPALTSTHVPAFLRALDTNGA